MKLNNSIKLVIAIVVSEVAGVIGAFFTTPAIQSGWYAGLVKPALNPPAWVFGPVWTLLFLLMGISLFLVWKHYSLIRANKRIVQVWKLGIWLFVLQLVLNTLWSIIFFGLHSPGGALVEIIFLWLVILATMMAFYKIFPPSPKASEGQGSTAVHPVRAFIVSNEAWLLLLPYILWVSFAMYLNYMIWALN